MSDPENRAENFLQRWSRRKRIAEPPPPGSSGPPESANAEISPPAAETEPPADAGAQGKPDLPVFDPATLPPIDSITATTDIRAFLAPGVPEELSRAALRRAWVSDPAIRDFIGLAENQWDFTKPDSVPGFGSLELTPELRHMVARLVGVPAEQSLPAHAHDTARAEEISKCLPPAAPSAPAPDPSEAPPAPQPSGDDAAAQTKCEETDIAPARPYRRHGGALPKC